MANTHWNAADPMTEATQLTTFGQHNDGMHFFPFPTAGAAGVSSDRGLLCVNHGYVDPGLSVNSASYGTHPLTAEEVAGQIASHGVSVIELRRTSGEMKVQRPSPLARRITGKTPMRISGPAAGNALLKTAADPNGTMVLGTLNNCAHGYTPWGTYLTCEENFNGYFGTASANLTAEPLTNLERRYGISATGFGYRWFEKDSRFDIRANRNEPNRFGWVVEIDPWNPTSMPVKRTALGRFKHESAGHVVGADNKVAIYLGDDERNDYMYKFVCAGKFNPTNRAANRNLLDSGVLYVARFSADGTGTWLPLVWGQGGLTAENGFADQAEVLIKARQAADRLGYGHILRSNETGGNMMSCADPSTGKITRFLTSPRNCEVTGVVSTPDGKTMFVGIQHPGEDWAPGAFTSKSSWPDSGANGPTTQAAVVKPRSSVVVITKNDGGVIGT